MNKKSNRNETREKAFQIEKLEERDAPKIAGGGLGDEPLQKGGGKPQKA